MPRKVLITVSSSILVATGLLILAMAGNEGFMRLFGSRPLPAAEVGDPGWVGVGFTRVCGAALASLGLVMMTTSALSDEAAKRIGGPLFTELALLAVVT